MRVFALSDIHIDYAANARWIANLSAADYKEDLLILAGDVTDTLSSLDWCLNLLASRFLRVLFVPGNHELWTVRERCEGTSLEKFARVRAVAQSAGASTGPFHARGIAIYPLNGWYDYSFGEPSLELRSVWMDFHACRWPPGFEERSIAAYFAALNESHIFDHEEREQTCGRSTVITFSHFLPRIDVIPAFARSVRRYLHPVLGSKLLDQQLRRCKADIHVFGHSHVNCSTELDGVKYMNNAFGYPHEVWTTGKRLLCIHEC